MRTVEEITEQYNKELKGCTTVDAVKELVRKFYDDKEVWVDHQGGDLRTKKGNKPLNGGFFQAYNPAKIEYICDSDSWTRCCRIPNLYRVITFRVW